MDAENQGKNRKITESSKRRQDDIHLELEKNLTDNTNLTIYCIGTSYLLTHPLII